MPKIRPPDDATALWLWMDERRVSCEELALLCEVTPQHLSDVRRGKRRPSDKLKSALEVATRDLERKAGVSRPKGVPVGSWFTATEAKS